MTTKNMKNKLVAVITAIIAINSITTIRQDKTIYISVNMTHIDRTNLDHMLQLVSTAVSCRQIVFLPMSQK